MLTVDLLTDCELTAYEEMLQRVPDAMIYSSLAWRYVLQESVPNSVPCYLTAKRAGRIIGTLPVFEIVAQHGIVLNSLPFFGSHGDVVIDPAEDRFAVSKALIGALAGMAVEKKAVALNLIAHPFRKNDDDLRGVCGLSRVDERISQISNVPHDVDRAVAVEKIFQTCHAKTRNQVRKANRAQFTIMPAAREEDWNEFHRWHVFNMNRIGGKAKTQAHLQSIRRHLQGIGGCELYIARKDGEFAGGLLVLLYRQWIEYFIPVAADQYRIDQVVSALILEAMVKLGSRGFRRWNWGGTWRSQDSLRHFKKGWGAEERVYGYYGYASDALKRIPVQQLAGTYEHCYLYPFGAGFDMGRKVV